MSAQDLQEGKQPNYFLDHNSVQRLKGQHCFITALTGGIWMNVPTVVMEVEIKAFITDLHLQRGE